MIHYFKTIVNSKFLKLVKSKELLADLVAGNGYGAAALARKIHPLSQKAPAQAHIQSQSLLPQIFPYLLFLFHVLIGTGFDGQDGADGHHDFQVAHHVMAELVARDLCAVIVSEHQTGH